jgi:hypothetical protein
MGYQQTQYGRFQYGTVTYAWNTLGPSLNFTDSITVTDSLSFFVEAGYLDRITIEEWFSIKLSGPIWTTTTNPVTTWTSTTITPINNPWTPQP